MLAAVGLDHPCDRQKRAGDLSGGMRRRLSTALALAGNPSVVVLDEPTAGLGERALCATCDAIYPPLPTEYVACVALAPFASFLSRPLTADPLSRRHVWDALRRRVAQDHLSVLLTTHSLDEAEALCHRLGIIVHGALQCLGTPLHLKQKYGRGYEVTVRLAPPCKSRLAADALPIDGPAEADTGGRLRSGSRISTVLSRFGAAFPSAEVLERVDNRFKVRVPKAAMDLPRCFALLDDMCPSEEAFYCVSLSSIEQVFLDVVEKVN